MCSVDGFLSLTDAAARLQTSPEELSKEITEGRVVAIVKDGESWLSPGEVSRLAKSRQATEPETESPATPKPAAEESPPQLVAPPAQEGHPAEVEQKPLRADNDLLQRNSELVKRLEELESINSRLKNGLQETEQSLRRSRTAKSNLENDIIALQDQLKRAESRSNALEREVQHLSTELERTEEQHSLDMRRFRSKERSPEATSPIASQDGVDSILASMREQMAEKDRIISQEYQERAVLRAQLEEKSQKYFELKARYDKEKAEWSEILARELQTHGQLKSQLEELKPKTQKGWNPFRRDK